MTRAEARRRGLKTYNTGTPCKHGHHGVRRVSNYSCVECSRVGCRKWYATHRDRAIAYAKTWSKAHPEYKRTYHRLRYLARRDEWLAARRKRYWADPEKARATSRAYELKRYWADPEKARAKQRAIYRRRRDGS